METIKNKRTLFRTTEGSKEDFTKIFLREKRNDNKLSKKDKEEMNIEPFRIYFDIETYIVNKQAKKPSDLDGFTYSFAFGIWNNDTKESVVAAVPTFSHFIDYLEEIKFPKSKRIVLVAHNSNKFDNWYVGAEAKHLFNAERTNAFNSALADKGKNIYKFKSKKDFKNNDNYVLERHVRSMNNLEIAEMKINGYTFKVIDNFPKTGVSLRILGDMLKSSHKIKEEQLKTEFGDYNQFDLDHWIGYGERVAYSESVFSQLNKDQMIYIYNDIHVLAHGVVYYSTIFEGFDWNKMTKTVNIKEAYLQDTNKSKDLAQIQLLKIKEEGDEKDHLPFSEFNFNDRCDLFDYFNHFYFGGLNFYNDEYVGKIIRNAFSIDLNSSYPYVMYHFKVPTVPVAFYPKKRLPNDTEFGFVLTDEDLNDTNYFSYYEVSQNFFNQLIYKVSKVSRVLASMFSKYYFRTDLLDKEAWTNGSVFVNTNFFRMLRLFGFIDNGERIYIKSVSHWKCMDFGSKKEIADFYFVKTQGKDSKKNNIVHFENNDPTKVSVEKVDKYNGRMYTSEMVAVSKVNLNGLYGLPALADTFDLGYRDEQENIKMLRNGHKNQERNVVFSAFVTSQALYNLLEPFKYFVDKIDDFFIYCDTDSLYLKEEAKEYIDKSIYDSRNLGAFDIEHNKIKYIHVLNHKKYCYQDIDEKTGKLNDIEIRCGGIPLNAFNTKDYKNDFEGFVKSQFSAGIAIPNNRSIRTKGETIVIRESKTVLDIGSKYQIGIGTDEQIDFMRLVKYYIEKDERKVNQQIESNPFADDVENLEEEKALYIESAFGAFSFKELYKEPRRIKYEGHSFNQENFMDTFDEKFGKIINKYEGID